MSRRSRTLRLKLTGWYLLVFALIQVSVVLVIVLVRKDAILRSNDDRLVRAAEALTEQLGQRGVPRSREEWEELVPLDEDLVLAAVRDRSQRVLFVRGTAGDAVPRFAPRHRRTTGIVGAELETIDAEDARELTGRAAALRLATLPFQEAGGNVLFLQVAAPAESISRSLGDYSDLIFAGLPAGLLAALVAGWLIAGRAVQPLLEMSKAAREVSPTNPGARMRVSGSEEEIARLGEELDRALDRMEAGFHAQEQFISNVSHELETPISVMMTELQVLERRRAPAEDYVDFADSAEEELRRLKGLVESFLKLARFQSGLEGFQLVDVPVQDIVLEAVQHCAPLAKLHQVRILPTVADREGFEGEAEISGDPQLLRTMIDNLIRNAIHFSPTHEVVDVVCRCGHDEVEFVVRDRGPGLPSGYLERIFERFTRVPDESGRARGTGLGLAIVREITELHGGRVSARNHDDRGCSFTVTLPLRRAQPGSAAPGGTSGAGGTRARDDDSR